MQNEDFELNFKHQGICLAGGLQFYFVNINDIIFFSIVLYEDWELQIWFYLQVSPP